MSVRAVHDHKFTPEEVQYLRDTCQDHLIAQNDEIDFPKRPKKAPKEEVLKLDADIYDRVVAMDLKELQQELRSLHIVPQGEERELRTLLAAHLQGERDTSG